METRKRILVAPLDWGLGHATRCIPLIRELLKQGFEVLIASNGDALALLREEFPQLPVFELPGYYPVYPVNGSMVWKMAFQLPKFIRTIAAEHQAIERIVKSEGIDVVVSDNRYGCFSKKAKSVFITHQLHILMPDGYAWLERRLNHFNAEQIRQYAECWVPVPALADSIIPRLMAPGLSLPLRPIGYLSRFEKKPLAKKYEVLVICSGPEPQRRLFEGIMEKQLRRSSVSFLIVRGKPQLNNAKPAHGVTDYLNATALNEAIEASEVIVSRSGYSMVMDLARLGKKAIFIPTPGQTEQEYLAQELMARKIAFCMPQTKFDLGFALRESSRFTGFANFEQDDSLLKNAIASL